MLWSGLVLDEEKRTVYLLIRQAGLLTMVPFALVLGMTIGFFIGDFLDRWWGTDPWLTVVFLLLGLAAGVRQTVTLITTAMER